MYAEINFTPLFQEQSLRFTLNIKSDLMAFTCFTSNQELMQVSEPDVPLGSFTSVGSFTSLGFFTSLGLFLPF
jgi:hypothetical protein